jgi:HK97 family phage prohead protease
MTPQLETRRVTTELEVRSKANGSFVINGYAAKFNTRSQDLGGFVEEVRPGAFNKALKEADVRALLNHDPNLVLGRNKSGTLRLGTDKTGLHYEVDLPDTTYARDLAVSMERGDITQSSFQFRTMKDDWALEDGQAVRSLLEVWLFDVSPATIPAYDDATSTLSRRSYERLAHRLGVDIDTVMRTDLRALLKKDMEPVSEEVPDKPAEQAPTTPAVRDELRRLLMRQEPDFMRQYIASQRAAD